MKKYIPLFVISFAHLFLTIITMLALFSVGMAEFDNVTASSPPLSLILLEALMNIFMFPFVLINNYGLPLFRGPGLIGHIPFIANSFLWAWTILYLYRRLKSREGIISLNMNNYFREILSSLFLGIGSLFLLGPFTLAWFIHGDYDRYLWIIQGPAPLTYFGGGPAQLWMGITSIFIGIVLIVMYLLIKFPVNKKVIKLILIIIGIVFVTFFTLFKFMGIL